MKLLYSAWTLVQIFGSFVAAKDGRGHVRVRGLQFELLGLEEPFENPMDVGFEFGETLRGKKNSGKKNGGGDEGPNSACCTGDRPDELLLQYTALTCGDYPAEVDGVAMQGEGKAACTDFETPLPVEDIKIEIVDNDGKPPLGGFVTLDLVSQTFIVQFSDGFDSNTFLNIYKGDDLFQKVQMHTSCSEPLVIGFNWGAFKLIEYGPRTGICGDPTDPPVIPTATTTTTTTTSSVVCENDDELDVKIDTGCKEGCPLCDEPNQECRVCFNNKDGPAIDAGCSDFAPICPVDPYNFGDECVFCYDNSISIDEYFDDGCSPEHPFCNAHEDGVAGEGTACFKCQRTDSSDPDPGCPGGTYSTCVALPGRFGNKCAPCINDKNNIRYSSTVMGPDFIDTGCKPESPVCFEAHYWEGGKACVKCVNDVQAEDPSHPDSGCSGDLPVCNAEILGEAGTECLPGPPIVPDTCNAKLRDPAHGPYFVNLVANALDPSFKYEPDSVYDDNSPYSYMVNHPKEFTVEIGLEEEHDPGFTCVEGGVEGRARTKIYGYGQDGVYTWPGKTFEVKKAVNIDVLWDNKILPGEHILTGTDNSDLPPIEVTYLPGEEPFNITPTDNSDKTVVDTSLHWAYSLKDIKGSAGFTGPCLTGTCFEEYGVPVVTHLHGGHSNFEFDGNPEFYFNHDESVLGPEFITTDYTYHNNLEAASIWYHDHGLGITRLNVYAGLAGFYFLRDPEDGDTGEHGNALGLPAFPYELAYAIQDRNFKNNGELSYPAFPGDPEYQGFIIEEEADLSGEPFENWGPTALAEFFGDHMVVNGKVWPKSIVEPRNYRLRLLNGCDSRFLVLNFVKVGSVDVIYLPETVPEGDLLDFYVIGSDQGLKEKNGGPVASQSQVIMGPGERIDVIIDFSQAASERVILKNSGGDEPFGGLPTGPTSESTSRIMAFDVIKEKDTDVGDTFNITVFNSQLPEFGHPPVSDQIDRIRRVGLFEGRDEYNRLQPLLGTAEPATDYKDDPVNWPNETAYSDENLIGQVEGTATWSTEPSTENPAKGETEEWYIINVSADAHPIHLHLVDFEVISRHALKFDSNLTSGEETEPVPGDFVPEGDGLYLSEQAVIQHTGDAGSGRKIEYSCGTADSDCWFESTPSVHPEYNDIGYPKDIVIALPGEMIKIKATFQRCGRYVWHCHLLSHEDHEMMRVMQVGPETCNF